MGQAQSSDQFLTQDGRYKQQSSQPGNSQLQNALPLTSPSSSQYNHGALRGAQTSPGVMQPNAMQGERLPLVINCLFGIADDLLLHQRCAT